MDKQWKGEEEKNYQPSITQKKRRIHFDDRITFLTFFCGVN